MTRTKFRRGWRLFTVRGWILTAVIGLAALAMFTAGYTAYLIQDLRVEARVDDELRASAEEFRLLAESGVDPATGEPLGSPTDLVRVATGRQVPGSNGGVLGIVDGRIVYTSSVAPLDLRADPEFENHLRPLTDQDEPVLETLQTAQTTYRVAVIPAHDGQDGGEQAALALAYDLDAEKRAFSEIFWVYAAVSAGSLGVVALVGWAVAGRLLRPVRVLADSARRIGREDLSERIPVTGEDDLAEMTRSVNEMLERLDGAFAAQRQLVNDVSHELRTPLTVISGHLQVMDTADEADVREARDLTLDEVHRMNRVIDDLLTLATAEHPQFLRPGPTDAEALTEEIFEKVTGLGGRSFSFESHARGPVVVDRQRVTQAVLQLAANAVKFSGPGSTIVMGSRAVGDGIDLWVRDEGPGIREEDRERIFERFGRAEPSKPGAGLGLPIVAAIAQAHGGEVRCTSEVGKGSTFALWLPRSGPGVVAAD
ncbi:sensor histidine kinase [Nesterenkonia lacusekhoensis]|uniref:histidine kinase n=1 Tax=Nesterenkonia lacusekhoensis TaxID=150832 RepID=A0ABS4T2G4_9MICC|nr:HAMP domain-containing sensor histidine kinase [Nesterenkonia lacusekhoensis]MBP2318625.1 signal transduction histidine kinase [Nesterenkonia lacusekhoensis]